MATFCFPAFSHQAFRHQGEVIRAVVRLLAIRRVTTNGPMTTTTVVLSRHYFSGDLLTATVLKVAELATPTVSVPRYPGSHSQRPGL